ncbi:SWIM zinc finger family protein [candidate division KSB1 bacterium]|nr:SWIM zinc finger family protein [candidate division KSB1 bacterium]RQW04692.1 MAG: SWIM zinc finger family protein [candidate division KSB1 bacterium]
MPLEDDDTVAVELKNLDYAQIAAFDQEAADGEALLFYENSQIENAVVYRNKLSGRIGNFFENYDVRIELHGKEITNSCTCSSERKICLHAIALLYGWINDADDFMNLSHVLADIEKIAKSQLMDIVTNILQRQPHMAALFLARKKLDWDEIDIDSFT